MHTQHDGDGDGDGAPTTNHGETATPRLSYNSKHNMDHIMCRVVFFIQHAYICTHTHLHDHVVPIIVQVTNQQQMALWSSAAVDARVAAQPANQAQHRGVHAAR